jgi:ferredoxin
VTPASGGIAARIAAGDTGTPMPTVSATSGADVQRSETVHTAEDGQEHWGPIDNDSARSKARGEQLVIDQWECISCGTCVENTDAVFLLPDDAKAVVTQQVGDMTLIQDAIDACPVTCIHWTDEPAAFEQLNDATGKPL